MPLFKGASKKEKLIGCYFSPIKYQCCGAENILSASAPAPAPNNASITLQASKVFFHQHFGSISIGKRHNFFDHKLALPFPPTPLSKETFPHFAVL
jgi:hypothetical protein